MKKLKKILIGLALFSLLFGLVSCNSTDAEEVIPTGMKIASCPGADYRLFVPQTWNLNTAYGISGAYMNLVNQSSVSVNRYEITAEQTAQMPEGNTERNQWYWQNVCLPPIEARALNPVGEPESTATTLDGLNARRYAFSALINGETLRYIQVLTEKDGAFYVFTFTATTEYYDLCISAVEKMLVEFRFDVPYEPKSDALVLDEGKDAPEGMKPAFSKEVAYRFYVPQSWEIDLSGEIYAAYCKEDRTSVSVVPYLPASDSMSVAAYFEETNSMLQKMFPGDAFEYLGETPTKLGDRDATAYEYRLKVNGEILHYRQIIAVYKTMVYSMTYTSREATYQNHLTELDQIIGAFSFR